MTKNKEEIHLSRRETYLTSAQAAKLLGFSQDHVRKLILQGKIKAEKVGQAWIISKSNLENIHRQRFKRDRLRENVENGSHQ